MTPIRELSFKIIPAWPVLLLLINWYATYPIATIFLDHETAIYAKYALTGIIPFVFGTLVIQTKCYQSRLWVNVPLLLGFIFALCQVYYMGWNLVHNPWPALSTSNISKYYEMISRIKVPYILCSILPLIVIAKLLHVVNQKLPKASKDRLDTHGSARLLSSPEIRKLNQKQGMPIGFIPKSHQNDNPQKFAEDIRKQKGGQVLRVNPDHLVLIAPSGAGKGIGVIIPTILDYPGSLVVTDIKAAENYHVTARYRREQGRDVHVFDPEKVTPQESISINVFDYLDPTSPKIVDDVHVLTSVIRPIPKEDYGNTKYFAEYGLSIIQCLILYVLGNKETPPEKKNLPHIYDLLSQDSFELTELFSEIKESTEICFGTPSRIAASILATTEREISGAFNSAKQELRFLDSPIMRRLTETSSMDLNDVLENKADLYICVPSEAMDTQGRAVRFLISTLFLLLNKRRQKPKPPLLMVLDEMTLLGRIPAIEKALVIGRGYGVKLMCIAQTIELLQTTYPDSWKTMLATNLSVFMGASDADTAKYISEKIGNKTIEYQSQNKGESQQKSSFLRPNISANEGESSHLTARAVLTPDEVLTLGDEVVVVVVRGKRPMLLRRIEYFRHGEWRGKADPNPLENN